MKLMFKLATLISKRASLAKQIGDAKHSDAGSGVVEFYRPEREAQVLRDCLKSAMKGRSRMTKWFACFAKSCRRVGPMKNL